MRARTALAGTTLAVLALLWTVPTALAADGDDGGSGASSGPSAPGGSSGQDEAAHQRPVQQPTTTGPTTTEPPTPTVPPEPPTTRPTITAPHTTAPRSTAPAASERPSVPPVPKPIPADPKAFLTVSPKTVRPGETVTANARCENGRQESLSGDGGVSFQGDSARIDQNAATGGHTVTLVCVNADKRVAASDGFTVTHDPNGLPLKASLALDPKTARPGDILNSGAVCQGGRVQSLSGDAVRFQGTSGRIDDNARDGAHNVTLVCTNGPRTDTASDSFQVDRNGPPGNDPRATLQVSPRMVRQGDAIYANGGCLNSRQDALFGDDVAFRGDRGWVSDNAREGDHTVTRICSNGGRRDQAVDHFRVIRGDGSDNGPGPRDLWLSDRGGYRGDAVDVSVRCRDDRARLDSDVLDDITLRRDGSRLTGTTHVLGRAGEGWHRVTVSCDGNRSSIGFWVLRDRADHDRYLDLDPAYGHPGDTIDVRVGCDSWLSSLDSSVLDDIDLDRDGPPWRYQGTTHVSDDAKPGEHTVRIRCGGDTFEADFFVQDRGDNEGDNGDSPGGGNDVTVYPKGAPETGGGPASGGTGAAVALGLTGLTGLTGAGLGGNGASNSGTTGSGSTRRKER